MNRRSLLTVAALIATSVVGIAQVRDDVQVQILPPSPVGEAPARPEGAAGGAGDGAIAGRESNQGVYVRDSAVAVEKFALAQRMERLKDWNKAADALQEVVEKHADRVMPSQVDAKNVIYQYTSVTTAVQERLAKWPPEGLDVYRARFEPQAAALLEQASPDDVGALHRAYALYFVTDTGKAAGLRLVDLYLESGEFPAAAWLAERLLAWHPRIDDERPKLTYRAALAHHLSGNPKGAAAKLQALKTDFPDARAPVRGQEVALAESLAKELETAPPIARGTAGDSWPMLGGGPDRSRVPDAAGRLGALIHFTEYARAPRPRAVNPADRQEFDRINRRARDDGLTLGVFPAVDRGEMFFQDNVRVYGVSLDTGVVLPGWQATYGDRDGRYVAPGGTPLPRNQHFPVTITESSVLAVTGQLDSTMLNQGFPMPVERETTRLVCLDRTSGRERWAVTPRQLPESAGTLRALAMNGSPLVVGDNVYVLARGGKPMQFEDTYILCYALKDGSYRWSCYLASGNADPNAWQGAMGGLGDNVTHLAYASGRLYALTNLGALAAVDAYSGTIVWLNIYPRPKPDFSDMRRGWNRSEQVQRQPKPWHHNPVIVKDGKVFILPDDAEHLLVYDAGSGVEVTRIRTADFENAKTLLGVVGDRMILCSDHSVFCVNWSAYNPKGPRDANLFWAAPFLRPGPKPTDVIRGRGFVTTDSVFIPTEWALFRISLKNGRREESYPRDRAWDAGEGPGNVLVTQDHVVIATDDRVNVYTDLTVARARLDAGVDAAPSDPEPRLRYAEMMFVSNHLDIGLEKLDEAIALLAARGDGGGGGANAGTIPPGPARDRVFSIALTFAQKLADPEAGKPEERQVAEALFDRAAASAHSPAQQVNYRMTRARFAEPPERVRLYQEVLADEQFRTVSYAAGEDGASQAATLAEAAIAEVIRTSGRGAYAAFETEAVKALETAQAAKDPAALLAVARAYPNAAAAPMAMIDAADAFESSGDPRRATQVLREVHARYRESVDPAAIIEGQVRNHLKLPGGVGVAIGRLRAAPRGAKLRKPLALPDGTTMQDVTFAEVAAALQRYGATAASEALPDFGLPDPSKRKKGEPRAKPMLPEEPDSAIADVDLLVVPRREFARHDRVIAWTVNQGLAIYPVGQTKPIGSHVAFADTPKGAAWFDADRVLVWGPTRAVLLAGKNGAALWEVTLKGMGAVELASPGATIVDSMPANANAAEVMMLERQRINMRLRARGAVVGNAVLPNGPVAAQPAAPPPAAAGPAEQIDHLRPTGDRFVFSTSTGRVAAVELSTGKPVWQTRLAEGPLLQLLANDDFTVARFADAAGVQIAALDTVTGQPVGPRRVFPLETGTQPVNMALAADGTLVWITQGQLCGKNLYEPGEKADFKVPPTPDGNPRYAQATLPEQLIVANGQILVVTDNGQMVRVHRLEDGTPPPGSKPLSTASPNPAVTLRALGSRLYIINPKGVASYNLDQAADKWDVSSLSVQPTPAVRDAMIGQDYVVLLDQLSAGGAGAGGVAGRANANGAPGGGRPGYRLLAHSRAQTTRDDGAVVESGRLDYDPIITAPAGISSEWQGVDGGFYYRALDRTLHYLRGARPAPAG